MNNKDIIIIDSKGRPQEKPAKTRRSSQKTLLRLTVAGVFAAFILVATLVIKVPTSIGYANLGDGVILFAAFLLGPFAFFPAAIGSALADLLAGYPVYIPATFVIKGLMGLAAGYLLKDEIISIQRKVITFVLAEVMMVAGYYLFETVLYGAVAAALSVVPNLIQAAVGIAIAVILCTLLNKLRSSIRIKMI